MQDVERRLVGLARGPAALRRALARVAGRMVETRGWERLDFARLGDYAVERAGVSARELRDLAAVDSALGRLPALEQAFLAGRLSWTKLRLVCRVATPEEQGRWLALAAGLSARELAREVRAMDREAVAPTALEEGGPREGVVLRITRRARARWWSARGVASKVAGQQLGHAAFAEVLTAEVLSGLPPGSSPDVEPEGRPAGRRRRRPGVPLRPRDGPLPVVAPGPEVEALERDLQSCDAFGLDRRLRRALALEARQLARVAALLAEVVALRLHRDAGFNSVDVYAEERLGIARSRARALLRVERAADECPVLRAAFAAGRLSWARAETLLQLFAEPAAAAWREAWVEHAARVSVRRLRDDVEQALALGGFEPPELEPGVAGPSGVQMGANAGSRAETARLFFATSGEAARLFRSLLAAIQRGLERQRGRPCSRSEALEAMLDHALAAWRPEPPTARERREWAVFERDGWRCAVPGCSSQRNLQRHHVVFRSRGGGDAASNLITLCAWHHLRGIHGGTLRCSGRAPDELHFELGLRPGRAPLLSYRSGDVLMS